jgi:hypothetical protein
MKADKPAVLVRRIINYIDQNLQSIVAEKGTIDQTWDTFMELYRKELMHGHSTTEQ